MGNISDDYCKRCKNHSISGCAMCTVREPYESFEGAYALNVPTEFEPIKTAKIPYEKMYNHNMSWITDMADNIGFDISIVKIEKIIFSGPATIVLWKGGGKTIVKYHKEKGCAYRKDLGVLYCIIKHQLCYDNTKLFHKFLKAIDNLCEAENGNKTT